MNLYNLCHVATSESGQFDNLLLRKKTNCVCPIINNEFRHVTF